MTDPQKITWDLEQGEIKQRARAEKAEARAETAEKELAEASEALRLCERHDAEQYERAEAAEATLARVREACERSVAIAESNQYDQGRREEAEHVLSLLNPQSDTEERGE